jgi:hypothetical protein
MFCFAQYRFNIVTSRHTIWSVQCEHALDVSKEHVTGWRNYPHTSAEEITVGKKVNLDMNTYFKESFTKQTGLSHLPPFNA